MASVADDRKRFKTNFLNILHSFRLITQVNGLFTHTLTLVSIRIYILSALLSADYAELLTF